MLNVNDYVALIVSEFNARKSYETAKNVENDSIQSTLNDMIKVVSHEKIAEVMMNSNVNAAFINRQERVNARFNVYSAEKVLNIAQCAVAVRALNHYTRAILLSAHTLNAHDMLLSHKDAVAACSLNCKTDAKREALIKSVRYAKHVDAKTASTQSSSSINALQMYEVLLETRDAANTTVYRLNTESETTQKLLKYCNAA